MKALNDLNCKNNLLLFYNKYVKNKNIKRLIKQLMIPKFLEHNST